MPSARGYGNYNGSATAVFLLRLLAMDVRFLVTLRSGQGAQSLSLRLRQNPVPLCGPWAFAFAPLQAPSLTVSPRFLLAATVVAAAVVVAAAAVVVVAATAAAATAVVIAAPAVPTAAAAAQQEDQDDDPPAAPTETTIVTTTHDLSPHI